MLLPLYPVYGSCIHALAVHKLTGTDELTWA